MKQDQKILTFCGQFCFFAISDISNFCHSPLKQKPSVCSLKKENIKQLSSFYYLFPRKIFTIGVPKVVDF